MIRQNDKPWFTSDLRFNIRVRDRLGQKTLRSKRPVDFVMFKKQRNKVNNMNKYAREQFNSNLGDIVQIIHGLFGS